MQNKINVLCENLCNQISAGEVVERPASVVKEVLENALDAGADRIFIEIERGGKKLIRITDNGCGMTRDDAFLCLERHATSKISSEEDLFRLQTLGFRGEAIPSIAAVSRFMLQTRPQDSEDGWEIICEGGKIKRADEVGIPCGTSIEVRQLFFNTPARRKFLRRDETELSHISDVVARLAMAHPQVHFSLSHNGKKTLELYAGRSLAERISAMLGRRVLDALLPVDADGGGDLKLHGMVSELTLNRSTASQMYTYINGRFIRDRVVQHAILDAYRNLLPKGRYPVLALFLTIDPALVDVNVHPTKHEVRFRDQQLVHSFIKQTVLQVLKGAEVIPEPVENADVVRSSPVTSGEKSEIRSIPPAVRRDSSGVQESIDFYRPYRPVAVKASAGELSSDQKQESGEVKEGCATENEAAAGGEHYYSSLTIIGQFHNSYILCQDSDTLLLIDQHAAHERIGFERLREQYDRGQVEQQSMLFPEVIDLDFVSAHHFSDILEQMERLGFKVEHFGGNSFVIKAIPYLIQQKDAVRLVKDVASEMAQYGSSSRIEEAVDHFLITMACHQMVRANQHLTHFEIKALLNDMDNTPFISNCPHGRPVVKKFPLAEIEKFFERT